MESFFICFNKRIGLIGENGNPSLSSILYQLVADMEQQRKHLKRREMSSDDEKRETVQFPWLLAEMDGE